MPESTKSANSIVEEVEAGRPPFTDIRPGGDPCDEPRGTFAEVDSPTSTSNADYSQLESQQARELRRQQRKERRAKSVGEAADTRKASIDACDNMTSTGSSSMHASDAAQDRRASVATSPYTTATSNGKRLPSLGAVRSHVSPAPQEPWSHANSAPRPSKGADSGAAANATPSDACGAAAPSMHASGKGDAYVTRNGGSSAHGTDTSTAASDRNSHANTHGGVGARVDLPSHLKPTAPAHSSSQGGSKRRHWRKKRKGKDMAQDSLGSTDSMTVSWRVWPDPVAYEDKSLLCLSLRHPLRKLCIRGIEWSGWDNGVLVLILMNTVQLMMFDPLDTKANLKDSSVLSGKSWPPLGRDALNSIGLFFTVCFIIECLVKVIALGFIGGPKSYLQQTSNWLDCFVVVISLVDFAGDNADLGFLSSLRLMRILRVLRAVTRFGSLNKYVVLLLRSIPMMASTLVTLCLLLLVFGILGVQLFQGALHGRCYNVDTGALEHEDICGVGTIEKSMDEFWIAKGMQMNPGGMLRCQDGKSECLKLGENPGRGAIHFDNIFNGVVTIFQIMTLEGWADLCYQLQDSTGFWTVIYFLFLVVLGPYFAVQLFLVVLSTNFSQLSEGVAQLSDADQVHNLISRIKEKVKNQKDKLNTTKPPPPTGLQLFRAKLRNLAKDETMNNTVLLFILFNTLTMATEGICSLETDAWCLNFKVAIEICNVLFTFVFALEALVKLIGLGPAEYLRATMNCFDFVIVVASLFELSGTFGTLSCYLAPLQEIWKDEVVRLGTNLPDKFLSGDKIAALTIPRAVYEVGSGENEPRLVVNPSQYFACGSGGFMSVMRAFRLVRLIKFLRGFPEIHKQVKILLDVIKSVTPLFVLISILLLVFTVLGMNLFGGNLTAEWDEELLMKGMEVYLMVPMDGNGEARRHGRIRVIDPDTSPSAPFHVELDFGSAFPAAVNASVGGRLDSDGMLWATSGGSDAAGSNVWPMITAIVPRFHFDNLVQAFITCFQVMTMANWNDDFYDAYASAGIGSFFYFALLIVLGNWMLINLFVAILLQKFFEQKAQADQQNMEVMRRKVIGELGLLSEQDLHEACDDLFVLMDNNSSGGVDVYELEEGLESHWQVKFSNETLLSQFKTYDSDGSGYISCEEFRSLVKDLLAVHAEPEEETIAEAAEKLASLSESQTNLLRKAQKDTENQAFVCLSIDSPLRLAAKRVVENRLFEDLVFVCILVSTTALAIGTNFIGVGSPLYLILHYADIVINVVFTIELVLKVISLGIWGFLRSGWNKLDVVIVVTSDLEMILSYVLGDGVSFLKLFRVFRALRPLRIVAAKMPGLSILVRTAEISFEPLCNTMVLVMAAGLLLGLFMMQLMGGSMNHCSDSSVWTKMQCVGLDDDGLERTWQRYYVNFDNLGQALFSQLILATQDDWPSHMLVGADVSGPHTGPVVNQSLYLTCFYMVSVIAMAFVVINMVVGVFVDAYYGALDEKQQADTKNHVDHKQAALTEKDMPILYDDPPVGSIRASLLVIVRNKKFDMLIAVFICANVLAMAVESHKRHLWQLRFDEVSNAFFALVFGSECIIKMATYRTRRYIDDNFNKFDFFLVMVTFLGYVIESLDSFVEIDANTLRMLRMLRILRILRALRLIRSLEGLQMIVRTLALSSSACANLMAMLMLVFFMFAVVLVNIFGSMCVAGDEARPGLHGVACLFTPADNLLDRHAHFQGVGIAIYTLFRIATGDDWGSVMESATLQPPRDAGWGFTVRPREPIRDDTWSIYVDLLSPPANQTQTNTKAVDIAVQALRKWYSIVEGREEVDGWPFPNGDGAEFVQLARLALPNCLSDEEAIYLQEQGVADCSVPGDYHSSGPLTCNGTCGLPPICAYLSFYLFFALAAFVLFQLVIGVLMDIYIKVGEEADNPPPCPGCEILSVRVLKRMKRRWLLNTRSKASSAALGSHHPAVLSRAASARRLGFGAARNRVAPINSDDESHGISHHALAVPGDQMQQGTIDGAEMREKGKASPESLDQSGVDALHAQAAHELAVSAGPTLAQAS